MIFSAVLTDKTNMVRSSLMCPEMKGFSSLRDRTCRMLSPRTMSCTMGVDRIDID